MEGKGLERKKEGAQMNMSRERTRTLGFGARTAILIGLVLTLQVVAQSAQAATLYKDGKPGTVTMPTARFDSRTNCFTTIFECYGHFVSYDRKIYASPKSPSSWQWVCLQHRLWQYTPPGRGGFGTPGKWAIHAKGALYCGWLAPTQNNYISTGVNQHFDLLAAEGGYGYALDVVITWQLAPNGTQIGKLRQDYNQLTDYNCPLACGKWYYADDGDIYTNIPFGG